MLLTSPSFEDGLPIPKKFTCDGGGINPELQIQNVPREAKSLALIVHDPDAPREGGFLHWAAWNISPATTLIKEESVPPGSREGENDGGSLGYFPPCPNIGMHHYHFKLYALDALLELPESAALPALKAEIAKHLIAEAELVGTYVRGGDPVQGMG